MAASAPGIVLAQFAPASDQPRATAEVRRIAATISEEFDLLGMRIADQPDGTVEVIGKVPAGQVQQACSERVRELANQTPSQLWSTPVRVALSQEPGDQLSREVVLTHVPADQRAEHLAARRSLDKAMADYPGFVSVDHYVTPEPNGDETWSTVVSFASAGELTSWRGSPEREQGVRQLHSSAADMSAAVPAGYGSWFSADEQTRSGPVWKQAMVVVGVIYATVSLLNMTLGRLVGQGFEVDDKPLFPGLGLPFPIVVFVGNVVGTILMTWVLMPYVTKAMDWWLRPTATAAETRRGLILMLVIYAVEMAVFTAIFAIWKF